MHKKILILTLIFLFSITLRIWNLNKMGRTWDEPAYVDVGNQFIKLMENGDLFNNYFIKWTDEPPLARYIYGLVSPLDQSKNSKGKLVFNYDYTYSRLTSALMSSLTVTTVVIFCWEFISLSVGIFAGIILAMLPFLLGLSQLASLESSIILTFTLAVYAFIRFLKLLTYKNAIIGGILLGLAILARFTNLLLLPLFLSIYIIWRLHANSQKINPEFIKKTITLIITSLATFIALWPMPFLNFAKVIQQNYELRFVGEYGRFPTIEVIFGRVMHTQIYYFFLYFLITTPLLILILFFIGSKFISDYGKTVNNLKTSKRNPKWIFYSLIAWFCVPFLLSFYHYRHHGVRYIIEIYVPLSIIAAIGFDYLAGKVSKKTIYKFLLFIPIIVYLLITLIKISPYYLDYFNGVVGGTKNVYEKRLFDIDFWGQGMREAGNYLNVHAPKGSSVALVTDHLDFLPPMEGFKISNYLPAEKYDYVIVNFSHVLRKEFDDTYIKAHYNLFYNVMADGAAIVSVYKAR